jgi:hypothetical protein
LVYSLWRKTGFYDLGITWEGGDIELDDQYITPAAQLLFSGRITGIHYSVILKMLYMGFMGWSVM